MAKRKPRSQAKESALPPDQSTSMASDAAAPPREPAASNQPHADRTGVDVSTGSHSTSMGSEPSEEDVRMRAYQRYLDRGGDHGADFDDWLKAERDLQQKPERSGNGN